MRILLSVMLLSGCVSDGYVLRSMSIDAQPRSIGMTWTFDNIHLPQQSDSCYNVCVMEE